MAKKTLEVVITGSAKGAETAMSGLEKRAGGLGPKFATMGKIAGAAFIGIGVAGAAAIAGLYKVGKAFDDASDTIRVGTGATGKALEGLNKDFKNVVSGVPASFEDASTAVADLNTRLGLSGKPLQTLSKQMLEATRITKGDLGSSIENITRVFGDWSISTADQSHAMDELFRASQATGVPIDKLAGTVTQFGSPLRAFGFSFEQAAALVGKFNKEGVNSEAVFGGLKIGLGQLLKAGKDPVKVLHDLQEAFQKTPNDAALATQALQIFGTRAGPDMVAALKEGRFNIDQLTESIKNGSDTIMKASGDTQDFAESFQMLKNKALVTLQPVASKVFDSLGKIMSSVGDQLLPVLADAMKQIGPILVKLVDSFAPLAKKLMPIIMEIAKLIGNNLAIAFKALMPVFDALAPVMPLIAKAFAAIAKALGGAFAAVLKAVAKPLAKIAEVFAKVLAKVMPKLAPVLEKVGKVLGDVLATALESMAPILPDLVESFAEMAKSMGELLIALMPILKPLIKLATVVFTYATVKPIELMSTAVSAVASALASAIGWVSNFGDAWNTVWGAISGFVANIAEWVGNLAVNIGTWIGDAAVALYHKGLDFITGLFNGIKDAAVWVWNFYISLPRRILGLLASAASWLIGVGGNIISGLTSGLWNAVGTLWTWLGNFPGYVIDAIGDIAGRMLEIGKAILEGIWKGIQNLGGWLKDKITGFFSGIWDGITGIFGIGSPSKKAAWASEMIIKGFVIGLQKNKKVAHAAVADTFGGTLGAFNATVGVNPSLSVGSLGRMSAGASLRPSSTTIVVQSVLDGKVIATAVRNVDTDRARRNGTPRTALV